MVHKNGIQFFLFIYYYYQLSPQLSREAKVGGEEMEGYDMVLYNTERMVWMMERPDPWLGNQESDGIEWYGIHVNKAWQAGVSWSLFWEGIIGFI